MAPMNNRLLRPTTGLDPDAATYLAAVEAADGEPLEPAVRTAISTFFSRIKADGLFDSIKASCILCGARTITGALVPLAGAAPTPEGGWASGDYSRTAGLTGDGAALYLDSNFAANSTDDDDHHAAVYVAVGDAGTHIDIGYTTATSYSQIFANASNNLIFYYLGRNSSIYPPSGIGKGNTTGLIGLTANSSDSFGFRFNQTTGIATASATQSLESLNYFVFARNDSGTPGVFSESKLAFYSIGTSVDLEALDTAVSNLISDIGNAL